MAAMEFIKGYKIWRMDWDVMYQKKKKKKPKSLAIRNFNTYLPTNFKTFQNRANPGSAFLKLKTNKSYYYQRDYVVIRMKT